MTRLMMTADMTIMTMGRLIDMDDVIITVEPREMPPFPNEYNPEEVTGDG